MKVVVDTNIIFSALLNQTGTISDLLINSNEIFSFYSPSFLIHELELHQSKILDLSGYTTAELNILKYYLFKKINFIDTLSIPKPIIKKSLDLTKSIDQKDTTFVALAITLDAVLWTGDKKLTKGLTNKGIDWILSTADMELIREKL